MISISHAPNATARQRLKAFGLLCTPWRWIKGKSAHKLEQAFSLAHQDQPSISFASGRQSLYAVLKALKIGEGDEVIIQAYTCIVVPHAVIWSGAKPVYADIDGSLNIDVTSAERLLTPRTKALIVQHTFGVPADMDSIMSFCKKHGLLLIEDCAHALGASYDGKPVGTLGDAAIFSFGRDKIISSVSGGMATAKDGLVAARLRSIQSSSPYQPRVRVLQNLLHPILVPFFTSLMPLAGLGSLLLRMTQGIGLLNKVYTSQELASVPPEHKTEQLPEALANLALDQFTKDLANFNERREALVERYSAWLKAHPAAGIEQAVHPSSQPVHLRYALLTAASTEALTDAKQSGIVLGDWYSHVIVPKPVDEDVLAYKQGSCPKAESAAKRSINLPTHPRLSARQQRKILSWLNRHFV